MSLVLFHQLVSRSSSSFEGATLIDFRSFSLYLLFLNTRYKLQKLHPEKARMLNYSSRFDVPLV